MRVWHPPRRPPTDRSRSATGWAGPIAGSRVDSQRACRACAGVCRDGTWSLSVPNASGVPRELARTRSIDLLGRSVRCGARVRLVLAGSWAGASRIPWNSPQPFTWEAAAGLRLPIAGHWQRPIVSPQRVRLASASSAGTPRAMNRGIPLRRWFIRHTWMTRTGPETTWRSCNSTDRSNPGLQRSSSCRMPRCPSCCSSPGP